MKKILPIIFFSISVSSALCQTYCNEWIHYDQTYLKFDITNDGIYRINYTALNASLAAIGVSLSSIDPRNFQLYNKGSEQYIYIDGENDGAFDASDFIEFYGQKNDGTFDSNLFDDAANEQLHTYTSIINDTAVYFLTWNNLITNNRLQNITNDLAGIPPVENYCGYNSRLIYGDPYGGGFYSEGAPHSEVFSSKYEAGEGFASYKTSYYPFSLYVATPHVYAGLSFTPTFKCVIIATNDVSNHHVGIDINGENYVDTAFNLFSVLRYNLPITNIAENNDIHFSYGPTPSETDYQRYSFIDIHYPRLYDFDNMSKSKFEIAYNPSPSKYIEVTNFDEKFSSPILYDLTAHKRLIATVESDISKFHLPYDASGNTVFISSQDISDVAYVSTLHSENFINYTDAINQGDYLIISHPNLYTDGAGINWVEAYRAYRASAAGGSYISKTIDINQLYDQFSYGIRKHPLAIRNFALYAKDHFEITPKYILLIGKSYTYDICRPTSYEYGECLVPTFGYPGSDNLLTARPGSVSPEIPIGRITTSTPDNIEKYYDKVVEYEAAQANTVQTIDSKAWMKNVLHFAGGLNLSEQSQFNNYLYQDGLILADTLYGANVKQFNKLSTDPIYYSESDYIDSIVNNGVSIITFFGHSASSSFDYNIGEPEEFNNAGKYFMVYGNGCNTSAIHGYEPTLAERYIFADHKAAIASVASSSFAFAGNLYAYSRIFYAQLGNTSYLNTIGDIMKAVADSILPTDNVYDQMTVMHSTLEGDPALQINNHQKPDYDIEAPYVFFSPEIISTSLDSFAIHIVVTNLGMAVDSSYIVNVTRHKPNGTNEIISRRYNASYFRDTIVMYFKTDPIFGVGLNTFDIYVDKFNEIDELDEMNNILNGIYASIISDDAIPIYPYEFSIVDSIPPYFASSTADVFSAEKQFVIQVDTTMNFNSPMLHQTHINESGGVIKWNNPPIAWQNNTVYYWRISLDTIYDNNLLWRSTSFLYLTGDLTGWNQSHYFQYLNDNYDNIKLQPSRTFEYFNDITTYTVDASPNWYEVFSYINGEEIAAASCPGAPFIVYVIDPATGNPWETHEVGETGIGPYGDIYCSGHLTQKIIQFNTYDAEHRDIFYHFLMDSVPDSAYVICYTNGYPDYNVWENDDAIYGHNLFDAFTSYGASDILSLSTYDYDKAYIFYAKKGDLASVYEQIGDTTSAQINASFSVNGFWHEGAIETQLIGPAKNWDKLQWQLSTTDPLPYDINNLELLGVSESGIEYPLAYGIQPGDTSLSWIDANNYPYLKLKLYTTDDTFHTPAQIDYWRVVYTPVAESALNANVHFVYTGDTVQQGEDVHFEIAITNVSKWNMDSLLVNYTLRDQNNILHTIPYSRQDSLLNEQTLLSSVSFNSKDFPAGRNTFIVEVNPANDQPEQFHFNNIGYLALYINPDNQNPLMDVTFDGVHILNGDIVSAKPDIYISLKDENKYLALTDTSLLDISILYPDNSVHNFYYDNITMRFYPADTLNIAENNAARVELTPNFSMDGNYELRIHGQDVAGNDAGANDYRITFEVINKPMISNVLNYPNPFTTQTHFVFTITGSEIPEYFKIQIMTVSGKIIREIMRNELGDIHIGNNITDFAWDGTDQYGDAVGNGLYLYRVVTKLHGNQLDKFNTNTDQYFKSGFGKMYLVR